MFKPDLYVRNSFWLRFSWRALP